MYVARFPASRPGQACESWNGNTWSTDHENALSVRENAGFTPMVCKVRDKYVLINSELSIGCDQGNEIYVSVSDHVTGPFSESKSIHTIDDTVQGHYPFFYVPVAHTPFINDKDEIQIGRASCREQGCQYV